ncbi:hypothetical protein [Marilutibacter chinensis]|uniref:Uncharacterized protein n=1 Tax=Marilutibacter chinensis TaxID=2912247 RepID=A0ABS9HVD6_9GAMM|nr:hypothetical protein [Lysobacter chinensis]MCF7222273.1 hypothetical protein [Lysobacter chinensis]
MALYMTQTMSEGVHPSVLYYRKQTQPHVSHEESGRFTQDAVNDYARTYDVPADQVEKGKYMSSQGKPKSNKAVEI